MSVNNKGNNKMNYTTKSGKRYYSKTVNGVVVTAWRDGCSIGVGSENESTQYFDDNKWSITAAIEFYSEVVL
jgi:hypothetical protein